MARKKRKESKKHQIIMSRSKKARMPGKQVFKEELLRLPKPALLTGKCQACGSPFGTVDPYGRCLCGDCAFAIWLNIHSQE